MQQSLSPELLRPRYRRSNPRPLEGHCYIAAEALYHLLGGGTAGFVACVARDVDSDTHWWVEHRWTDQRYDPTAEQYLEAGFTPPYVLGRRTGFLTSKPSKRAQIVIERAQRILSGIPRSETA